MEVKAEYRTIFCEEAHDQLKEWEESLLALEKSPGDGEQVNRMFRAIHTLKGSAGFIGYEELQKVAHALESTLQEVREGARELSCGCSDLLFRGLDVCRGMIGAFAGGSTPPSDIADFLACIEAAGSPADAERAKPQPVTTAVAPEPVPGPPAEPSALLTPGAGRKYRIKIRIDAQPRESWMKSFIIRNRLERCGRILGEDPNPTYLRDSGGAFAYTIAFETTADPARIPESLAIDQVHVDGVAEDVPAAPVAPSAPGEPLGKAGRPDEVVRVSVQKLDTLLNLVGELVIQNSGFVSIAENLRERLGRTQLIYDLQEKTEALGKVTADLQDGIMKARMLPIANVFNRFQRVVRDLAKSGGKDVTLEVFGEETEIDKKVIDRIGEPLVHLVRNAVDHGIEPRERRAASGKSTTGTIRLGAYQESDHICIEVSDDGRGLDRGAILAKAAEKGLIGRDTAQTATPEQILGFIFLPGFSTAERVSDVSGRGVGMDVVKRAVEAMGGSIRVRTSPGHGTTITISLPLTTAIITAVLVEVSGSTFAIPLSAVREILKTREATMQTVGTRRVIRLRDDVLALVHLGHALHAKSNGKPAEQVVGVPVVVVDFQGDRIGLEVDRICGTREIVIKSLSRHYREIDGLTGASILGNGLIALIVDVESLIKVHRRVGNGKSATGKGAILVESSGRAEPVEVPVDSPPPAGERAPSLPPVQPLADPESEVAPSAEAAGEDLGGGQAMLLEEINNNGAVQASISLSQLTGQEIRVSFPENQLVKLQDVADMMGGEEAPVGGIYVAVHGDLTSGILMVIPMENLLRINDLLLRKPAGTTLRIEDVDMSGLSEMGNILSASFINAMAGAAGLVLKPQVPEISVDMCLSVIDSVLARFSRPGDSILLTQTVIYWGSAANVVCHLALFLEPESLARLISTLKGGKSG